MVQQGRPNKKLYSITRQGRERLIEWSSERTDPPPVKDDMMVKLYGLEHVDRSALAEQIAERLRHHEGRLALYERIEGSQYRSVPPDDPRTTGRYLGLQLGLAYERAWIQWCREALSCLESLS